MQVCGASAGMLQGGSSGEALLSHLLSDISPPADTLKVSAPGPGLSSSNPRRSRPAAPPPPTSVSVPVTHISLCHQLRSPRGSPDGGLQTGKPSAPKKLKLDVGEAMAPPSHRKGDSNANSDVCTAALRGGSGPRCG